MVEKKEETPIVATPSTLPQLHITNPFLEDLMPSAVLIKTSDESPKRTSSSPNSYILVNDDDVFIDCEIDYAVKKQQQNDSAAAAADETAIAEAVISTRLSSSSASSTSSSRDGAALTDLEDEEEEDAGKQQNSDYDNVNNINTAANNKQVKCYI